MVPLNGVDPPGFVPMFSCVTEASPVGDPDATTPLFTTPLTEFGETKPESFACALCASAPETPEQVSTPEIVSHITELPFPELRSSYSRLLVVPSDTTPST